MNNNEEITWEKREHIGLLSINNPPENYLNNPEFISMDLLKEISTDKTIKGIIIKGTGRHFSAGANLENLKKIANEESVLFEKMTKGKALLDFIENLRIPVIAAVSGVCFGGGLEIALVAHIRICTENAIFAFPETNYNIMPGLAGTIRLAKLIGKGKAAEIILSGEVVNSVKAKEVRLVDYIVPSKEINDFTIDFLNRLVADRDPDVIESVMMSIQNAGRMSFEDAVKEETKLFCRLALKNMKE